MPEHTPGPWYAGAQNDSLFIIDQPPRPSNDDVNPDHDVTVIAKVYQSTRESADAKLIAAAPDLYDACKAAIAAFGDVELILDGRSISPKEAERFKAVVMLVHALKLADGEGSH